MNQFLSNKIIAGIVALALLVGVGVLVSSGDTSSTTRNAALVVATPCTKPGQVTKVSKQSVVCATTNSGSLWYATMKAKGKAQACTKPGAIREKSKIVWVCGVIKKKKLWQATQPLSALAAKGDLPSTTPATPDAPVNADNKDLADSAGIDTAAKQTLALAKPASLSLETQPLGGVNALALETQPVVQLLDQTGASISTAGITITADSGRAEVKLSGNTAVTDATGRATFTTLSLTGIIGDVALTFAAPRLGLVGVKSRDLDLAAGVANALVSDTKLEAVAAGKFFNQFHKLHLEDSSGNVVAGAGRNVVVSSSTEGLSGTTTVPTAKDGYVLFKNLALTETGITTLTFTSGDLSTTSTVEVMPGDSKKLEITREASKDAINDVALVTQPVVQLLDAKGNNVTTAGFKVTATITQFPTSTTATTPKLVNAFARTNAQGVATFNGLTITGLIGDYILGFTPDNGVTQPSDKITLKSGEPKELFVLAAAVGLVGDSIAGTWSLTQPPAIGLRDVSNNPVEKENVTVTATLTGQDITFSADTDDQGKAVIPITFSGDSAGLRTITYKASNVINLTETINLPPLTPVVTRALTVPNGKNTTSENFPLTAPESNSRGAWTYTSSNEAIATVDSEGKVTPGGAAGRTKITATQAASGSYAVIISEAYLDIALTPTALNQPLAYPTNYDTTSGSFSPSQEPMSDRVGDWTYTIDKPTIATVDLTSGRVTPKGVVGTVIITATQAATTRYAHISTNKSLQIYYQAPVYPPGLNADSIPFDLLTRPASKSSAAWTYTSLNSDIATVNPSTGRVTLKSVGGTVTIRATQAANSPYAVIISEATVVISRLPVVVSPAWVLLSKYADSSPYALTAPKSNSSGAWTYTSDKPLIAAVNRSTGTVTPQGVGGTVTITATQAATSRYAAATTTADLRIYKSYQVGEPGPGGGTVFYVAPTPQTWGRYLEAAPTDYQVDGSRQGVQWCYRWDREGETAQAIGTGKDNTNKINGYCGGVSAAAVANDYSTSMAGAGQWFLPSRDELNELCKIYSNGRRDTNSFRTDPNRCTGNNFPTGGFADDYYWSSSEINGNVALSQNFNDGGGGGRWITDPSYVRPVRAF